MQTGQPGRCVFCIESAAIGELPSMLKRQISKKMIKNELQLQTILTKKTDFHVDRVLLLGRVTDKKNEANFRVKRNRIK